MDDFSPELKQAIEQVYAAFADIPKPTRIPQPDIQAISPEDERALLTLPLRELSSYLMREYIFEALILIGEWHDFCSFLPRLLEWWPIWEEEGYVTGMGWRIAKGPAMEHGFPLTDPQKAALRAYALAYFAQLLAHNHWSFIDFDQLEPFGVTRAELLELWRRHPQGASAFAFHFVVYEQTSPAEWTKADVSAWFKTALSDEQDEGNQQILSEAILKLETMSG